MMIHEITEKVGKYKSRKRIGRGNGSGTGTTAGRGHKGAKSRAGFKRRPAFEGGQMSIIRRMPKRGFTNAPFRNEHHIINVQVLESRLNDGDDVSLESLVEAGIVADLHRPLKILGEGELTKKLNVSAAKFSKSAREKIEKAGGTATVVEPPRWRRAGAGPGKKRLRRQKAQAAAKEQSGGKADNDQDA